MNVLTSVHSSPALVKTSRAVSPATNSEMAVVPQETFTFSSAQEDNSWKRSPIKEALTAAALVGVPAALGAVQSDLFGTGASALVNLAFSPAAGAVLGGTAAGVSMYKESRGNALIAGAYGIIGGAVGGVAFPLLKLPGTFGGYAGAAIAAGTAAVGVAIWAATDNAKEAKKRELATLAK